MVTALEQKLIPQGFRMEDRVMLACNGTGFGNLLRSGRQWLEAHVEIVNNLNIFPVPDGDTGTNMLLTLRAATEEMERTGDDYKVGTLAQAAAYGALMGARGNSGVILSQFLHGMALELADKTEFLAGDLARATKIGADWAYQSVIEPVEGTILTVARAVADATSCSVRRNPDLGMVFADIVEAARLAQSKTPELLPILREAGVTDSGGQGLVYILEGALRFILGQALELDSSSISVSPVDSTLQLDEETYGYDVQFLIQGDRLNIMQIRSEINGMGQSTLVVGDEHLVKVHLHASDPRAVIAVGARYGEVSQVVVEDLSVQARQFLGERRTGQAGAKVKVPARIATEVATVAVVPGQGLTRIFDSLGISRIVPGGPSMNPSIQELLEAVRQVKAAHVLILPNNGNVIMTAQQVKKLAEDKSVEVIPTKTVPQGLAALLAFNDQADLATNQRRMLEAAHQVQTIEVTRAVRPSTFNGFEIKQDAVVGLLNGTLAATGQEYHQIVIDVLGQIEVGDYEILTMYYGQESSTVEAETLMDSIKRAYPELEFEIHPGGQPHYQYIISLE
jgi:DAK2 domain fusion protein YloV